MRPTRSPRRPTKPRTRSLTRPSKDESRSCALAPDRALLDWSRPGGPFSLAFDDVYASAEDALGECEAVFLDGCGLPQSWAGRSRYVVGELGFGSGLTFLALWRRWIDTRPAGAILHFVSVEGAPLSVHEAARAHSFWPELAQLSAKLRAQYPPRIKGVHRRRWDADGVVLTIAHLPVEEALNALEFRADTWFLDGFAPSRNPDMWSQPVLNAVAAHCVPKARLATYTVAGAVRRGLEAAGFVIERKPGFGRKRERLEAALTTSPPSDHTPTLPRPNHLSPRTALIIGAGLAGASLASALSKRGIEARVLCAGPAPADQASGAQAGLVMPRLDRDDRPSARVHRAAYAFALNAYRDRPDLFTPLGAHQLATDDAEAERLAALAATEALPPDMAHYVADIPAPGGARAGLVHPPAGIARPAGIVADRLRGIEVRTDATVARLEHGPGGWRALSASGVVFGEADAVVLACGVGLNRFAEADWIPIRPSRGQVTHAPCAVAVDTAYAFGGYFAPIGHGVMFGATYDAWPHDHPPDPEFASDQANHASLRAVLPELADAVDMSAARGWASVRATSPDHMPYCGPVVDEPAFRVRFDGLRHGRMDAGAAPSERPPGLWALGGLGSRGLVWSPLLAEALASAMCCEPGAVERGAADALHPARAIIRAIKRGD